MHSARLRGKKTSLVNYKVPYREELTERAGVYLLSPPCPDAKAALLWCGLYFTMESNNEQVLGFSALLVHGLNLFLSFSCSGPKAKLH